MYNKKVVFGAACVGMLLFGMVMLSLGTINTFLTDKFSLDTITVGSLAALLPLGILIGSLIFGPVVAHSRQNGLQMWRLIRILINSRAVSILCGRC